MRKLNVIARINSPLCALTKHPPRIPFAALQGTLHRLLPAQAILQLQSLHVRPLVLLCLVICVLEIPLAVLSSLAINPVWVFTASASGEQKVK